MKYTPYRHIAGATWLAEACIVGALASTADGTLPMHWKVGRRCVANVILQHPNFLHIILSLSSLSQTSLPPDSNATPGLIQLLFSAKINTTIYQSTWVKLHRESIAPATHPFNVGHPPAMWPTVGECFFFPLFFLLRKVKKTVG